MAKEKPIDTLDTKNIDADRPPQSNEEEKEALRVQRLFQASYTAKYALGLPDLWRKCDEYVNSNQGTPEHADDPNSTTNIIKPIIQSQISDMLDKEYAVNAMGREIGDDMFAQQASHIMQFVLDRNRFKNTMDAAEHDRLELGTSVYKVYFDDNELEGRGLPIAEPIDPANFFPDPKIRRPEWLQRGEFNIHAVPRALSWFRTEFPKLGKYVKRQVAVPYDPDIYDGESADETDATASQRALCIECYERDENGKLYRLTVANNLLLEDTRKTGETLQRRNKYPFVVIPCYRRRGQIWGMGDAELLIPTQDLVNELDDQIRINARLMGNPQIVVGLTEAGKGFDLRKWTSKPGLRIPMRSVNGFREVKPQQVSNDVVQRREKAFQEADIISGRPDVTRGEQPSGVTAYRAIAALQQAGQKGVIYKNTMFKEGMKDVLKLLFDEVIEHYDENMWVRVEGKTPDYKFYNPADFKKVKRLIPNRMANGQQDQIVPLLDKGKEMTRDAQFDFEFIFGDGLGQDKKFVYESLLDLSKIMVGGRPLIPWEALYDYLREEIGLPLPDPETLKQQEPQMQPPQVPGAMPQGPPQGAPQAQQPMQVIQGGAPNVNPG